MRALSFSEFGDPSRLSVIEHEDPRGSPELAVVRVAAASVNRSDVKNVAGQMEGTTLPRIPGRDFSGIVEKGPAAWLGAEVWGTDGELGFTKDGTHAERVAFPVNALARKPRCLTHEQACTVGVPFVAAWLGCISYARLEAGETIAVVGAGGAVGSAVVQIARALGSRVIGIGRTRPSEPTAALLHDFVKSDGDFSEGVRRLTHGGAEVVFDTVGGVLFEPSLRALRHRGRLVEISSTGRRRVEFDLIDFYHNEAVLFGADTRKLDASASMHLLTQVAAGFEAGRFQSPAVAGSFALDDGARAYGEVARGTAGRVLIVP